MKQKTLFASAKNCLNDVKCTTFHPTESLAQPTEFNEGKEMNHREIFSEDKFQFVGKYFISELKYTPDVEY